jgi:hypothetical protein
MATNKVEIILISVVASALSVIALGIHNNAVMHQDYVTLQNQTSRLIASQ